MRTPERKSVVAVWNELTPYRLHVMRRTRDEIADCRVVNVFTHSVTKNSSPWAMDVSEDLNIEFDEPNRVPKVEQFAHRRAWRLADSIMSVIRREQPVFVLMHGHNDLTRVILIHRLRSSGVPMVHASDSNIFSEQPGRGWRRPLKAAYRAYRSHLLSMMDGYMPMGIAGKAFYAVNGRSSVPRFVFPYEPDYRGLASASAEDASSFRARHGIDPARKVFLCSSRLVPVKRVDLAIRAFSRIMDEFGDWDLVIAGEGPLRRKLERLARERGANRVHFLGFVQMHELRCAYACAQCLVHPSEREPWGLIINEAANAGLPIIATDVTGAAIELVRDRVNGRLVQAGDEPALADAMRWVAAQEDLDSLRRASGRLLAEWRGQSDPVAGLRSAIDHFATMRQVAGT